MRGLFTGVEFRFVPEGSSEVKHDNVNAVIYVKDNLTVIAYSGKKTKSDWYIKFTNIESRDRYVDNYIKNLQSKIDYKKSKADEKKLPHNLVVGDIMTCSWGYDQTNVDCYQVISTTAKTVKIQRISSSLRGEGFMAGYVTPVKDSFIEGSEILTKKVDHKGYASMTYGCLSKWDGRELYCSWYA